MENKQINMVANVMWGKLPSKQKIEYQKLITNFASLSEAFAQKEDGDRGTIIAPIVNSKFQETAFKKAFMATVEDIGNLSYDASIKTNKGEKFLIGIKSFGINSGFQKIAQFKKDSQQRKWSEYIDRIKKRKGNGLLADDNKDYLSLAKEISEIRNERIASSISQLRGFVADENDSIVSVYHVLMPSRKMIGNKDNNEPSISVGELDYVPIDIDNIEIKGPTSSKNVQNFQFTDGRHLYQYNSADSQLMMSFKGDLGTGTHQDIVKEKWPITYIDDPFQFFANLSQIINVNDHVVQSFSWLIKVETRSGFNAWYGAPKSTKEERKKIIEKIKTYLQNTQTNIRIDTFIKDLTDILLDKKWLTNADKKKRELLRENITEKSKPFPELFNLVTKALYRSYENPYEVYIPIPNALEFNTMNPNFFGNKAGLLNKKDKKKMELDINSRKFELELLPSGDKLSMVITQDYGKGIESKGTMYSFGKWVLKNVFQLKDHELLTDKKLEELKINAVRFKKYDDGRPNSLEFFYIDTEREYPSDFWK